VAANLKIEVKETTGKVRQYDPTTTKKGRKSLKQLKEKKRDNTRAILFLNKLK
jgi:DNA-binding sugar fermentation-stimulating protein